jgi:hypothetical protein
LDLFIGCIGLILLSVFQKSWHVIYDLILQAIVPILQLHYCLLLLRYLQLDILSLVRGPLLIPCCFGDSFLAVLIFTLERIQVLTLICNQLFLLVKLVTNLAEMLLVSFAFIFYRCLQV